MLSFISWLLRAAVAGLTGEDDSTPPPAASSETDTRASNSRGRRGRQAGAVAAVGGVLAAAVATAVVVGRRRGRNGLFGSTPGSKAPDGRIPLKDVVRFKERQWFVEELEGSRDGDANAMLRLSKMYLHGQGCQRNITMAQEWLKQARYQGVGATLEELLATDDPDPRRRLKQLVAAEERRRALRKKALTAGHAGGAQPP